MKDIRKFYSPDAPDEGGYGYASDEVKQSPFNFGLNANVTKLTKFEWIPNGGKDGAEQEALDIVFNINGTEKKYRQFPVTKVFDKNGGELTDTNSKEYKDAKAALLGDFSARMVHILHAFIDDDTVKAAISRPVASFKQYCNILQGLLPNNFAEVSLDVFMQYQWQPSDGQSRTYLDLPKKMSYGAWLKKAIPGTWVENRVPADQLQDTVRKALWYINENGEEHPFVRNGWFMLSNFANLQSTGGGSNTDSGNAMNANATQSPAATQQAPSAAASAW